VNAFRRRTKKESTFKKMQLSQVEFSQVAFTAFAASKGVKTAAASLRSAPVEFVLSHTEFFATPFGASAFQSPEATRLNLELDVSNSPVLVQLQHAEEAILQKAFSDGIFEGATLEEVKKQFHSSVSCAEKYQSHRWRTKLNTAGMRQCRFSWHRKSKVPFEDLELRTSTCRPHVWFKGLWKQGSTIGCSWEVLNLLVQPATDAPDPF